jgi:hypothetical protein
MKSLAEALSYSVAFLASIDRNDEDAADDDCDALESITAIVRQATPPELAAIRAASESAIATLLEFPEPDHPLIQGYRDCIENFCNPTE